MNTLRPLLFLSLTLSLLALSLAMPVTAAPHVEAMRWAHSWDEAIEEAWLRETYMFVHLQDDQKNDSQSMYKLYRDSTLYNRLFEWVNVPVVTLSQQHPWKQVKTSEGNTSVSKIFYNVTKNELNVLRSTYGKHRKTEGVPAKRPVLACYKSNGGLKDISTSDLSSPSKIMQFVLDCTQLENESSTPGQGPQLSVVPVEVYLTFVSDRKNVYKQMEKENWSRTISLCEKMKTRFADRERFLTKIDEVQDDVNQSGLDLLDTAMEIEDTGKRRKQLLLIAKAFGPLDAGQRAIELANRY